MLTWCRACQCHTICLWLQQISTWKQKSGDFRANKHKLKATLFFYNWNERVWKHDRMMTDPTCSDTRKGEKTQANRNLNNWAKHHLPKSRILIVEPRRKVFKLKLRKKRLLLKARLAVCQLHAWNQTIFTPFHWLKRPTWQ